MANVSKAVDSARKVFSKRRAVSSVLVMGHFFEAIRIASFH